MIRVTYWIPGQTGSFEKEIDADTAYVDESRGTLVFSKKLREQDYNRNYTVTVCTFNFNQVIYFEGIKPHGED